MTVVDDLSTGRLENLRAVASRIDFRDLPLGEVLDEPAFIVGFDVIFHLAANPYIPPSVEDPAYDYRLNLDTTFRLLEALRQGPRRPRLVYTSSAAVYGDPQRLPIRESDPTVPISPYGVSKLAAERYVAVYSQLYALPCFLRSSVLGLRAPTAKAGGLRPVRPPQSRASTGWKSSGTAPRSGTSSTSRMSPRR